jgi:hypothetical protein
MKIRDLTDLTIKMKIRYGSVSKPCTLVNIKIAGKWMFIPVKKVLIGIDPYPTKKLKVSLKREQDGNLETL